MSQNESQSPSSKPQELNQSQPEQNSTPPEEGAGKLQKFKELLKDDGVDFEKLAIFMLGGAECIIGELVHSSRTGELHRQGSELRSVPRVLEPLLQSPTIVVRHPKRVMRRQEQSGGMMSIIFYLSDLDLISGGLMEIKPVAVSAVKWLNLDSQISYAGLYVLYLEQRKEDRLRRSGLVKPSSTLPPHLIRPDLR